MDCNLLILTHQKEDLEEDYEIHVEVVEVAHENSFFSYFRIHINAHPLNFWGKINDIQGTIVADAHTAMDVYQAMLEFVHSHRKGKEFFPLLLSFARKF